MVDIIENVATVSELFFSVFCRVITGVKVTSAHLLMWLLGVSIAVRQLIMA